ncbi:MAG TPA: SEC-C metal-binding domain-containing protein [Paenibacillus sp.]|nr:SEC-C metal-binding domain-containing protein [Paenibacillus sp.]
MLTPDQIKPFIVHPELTVAHAAMEYFSKSNVYEHDLTLMPLVLQKFTQVKQGESFYLHMAQRFPQTTDTVQQLIDFLSSKSLHPDTRYHVSSLLLHSDLALLAPYLDDLSKEPSIGPKLQQRLDIQRMTDDALQEALEMFIKNAYGKYYNEIDTYYGEALVEELGSRSCITEDQVLQRLSPDDDGYGAIYYIKLAGQMRLTSAVPALCSLLEIDDDVTPAEAGHALVKIGTDDVVTAIRETYLASEQPDFIGVFACGLFGDIKRATSEEALLYLLQQEKDITNATLLADALCRLGSVKGIPLVKQLVEEGYDSMMLNLKESLYALCVMAGERTAEVAVWKQELEDEERRRLTSSLLNPAPVRAEAKVGRNDPCPCGSGKKYKKCCGA